MKLCVALDLPSAGENLALLELLKDKDLWVKVGLRSFIRDGALFLEQQFSAIACCNFASE